MSGLFSCVYRFGNGVRYVGTGTGKSGGSAVFRENNHDIQPETIRDGNPFVGGFRSALPYASIKLR